jgi:hypothetical protein
MDIGENQRLAKLLTKKFSRFFHVGLNEGPQKSMKNSPPGFESMGYCVKVSNVCAHFGRNISLIVFIECLF